MGGLQSCPAAFLSFFLSVLSFLFSFSFFFFTMLLALSDFLLTRTNVELKSYNLNRLAKPTRCHPFNSFLQQTGAIICMVVIFFCNTWVNTAQKMIMMKKLSRKSFIEAATWLLRKAGKKVSSVKLRETVAKNTWNFFVIEPIAAPSACSFLPGAVNLAKPS